MHTFCAVNSGTAGLGDGGGDSYGAPRLCGIRPWIGRSHGRANRRSSVPGWCRWQAPGRTRVCARTTWGLPGCRYGSPGTEPDRPSLQSEGSVARWRRRQTCRYAYSGSARIPCTAIPLQPPCTYASPAVLERHSRDGTLLSGDVGSAVRGRDTVVGGVVSFVVVAGPIV